MRVNKLVFTLATALVTMLLLMGCDKGGERDGSQPQQKEFIVFMTKFYPAYKANNWSEMVNLAKDGKRNSEYSQLLIDLADFFARPGLKDGQSDWSGDDLLNSQDHVRIALSLLASEQGKRDQREAELSDQQKKKIFKVWLTLYRTALNGIGTADERPPSDTREPRDKLESALQIARLVREPARETLAIVGKAWLAERTGDSEKAVELKKEAARLGQVDVDYLPWPPISAAGIIAPSED